MKSMWIDSQVICCFSENEYYLYMNDNEIRSHLANFEIIGLIGWDDFILKKEDKYYSIPTVPIDFEYLKILEISSYDGKHEKINDNMIKWYIRPLIFGGSPIESSNIIKITLEDHVKAVSFWNKKYFELKNENSR